MLGLILASFWVQIGKAAVKRVRRFCPYYVWVSPNWYKLLPDFKLIGNTPEEWAAIRESYAQVSSAECRVMREGIIFRVLQQSDDFERSVILSDNFFQSEMKFVRNLRPIGTERNLAFSEYQRVELFLKSGRNGYDLGLKVPTTWWEDVKQQCPKPIEERKDEMTGEIELVLATISYREFDLYWEPTEWSYDYYSKTLPSG